MGVASLHQAEEAEEQHLSELNTVPRTMDRAHYINYAALTCGAQVVDTNPGAKNSKNVLDADQDVYVYIFIASCPKCSGLVQHASFGESRISHVRRGGSIQWGLQVYAKPV